ncbi:hypothetical protein GZL_00401 [Streptomyces sp. 769]|nr:hypothetical protein GZL_00401 [Streptomyces sp. 769]
MLRVVLTSAGAFRQGQQQMGGFRTEKVGVGARGVRRVRRLPR